MCSKKYFSRLLPFFATFMVGIFIAGLFGAIGRPSFGDRRARHFQEDQQIRLERDQLREENMRLRRHHCDRDGRMYGDSFDSDNEVRELLPPPPPLPGKPAAPRSIR